MEVKGWDPRNLLKTIIEDYKITPYTFSLISGLDEKTILDYANHKNDLSHLPNEKIGDIGSMIGVLSDGMISIAPDERVTVLIEALNEDFQISSETLAIYAKIDEQDVDKFMKDSNSLTFEKRYRLAVTTLFLFKVFSDYTQNT
jgi:hypothetical protein